MRICPTCNGGRSAHRDCVGDRAQHPDAWQQIAMAEAEHVYWPPGTVFPGYRPFEMIQTCPTCKGAGVLWD